MDEINGARNGQRDLQRAEPAFDRGVRDGLRSVRIREPNDEDDTGFFDPAQRRKLGEHASPFCSKCSGIDGPSLAPYR